MNDFETLGSEYYALLSEQPFIESELDYSVIEKFRPSLDRLAEVSNSGITVFDLLKKEHVYTSYNFSSIFGYDLGEINEKGNDYFNSRVHPDDLLDLLKKGIAIMKFYYQVPKAEREDYKLINEYRILGGDEKYIRVIEQHQVLQLDNYGNLWLTLSVLDVSPDQDEFQGIKSQLLNFKTGKIISNSLFNGENGTLTKREAEILSLIKDGFLSKEISDKLSISVHTVNTHRQRILEKFNVSNSIEAVNFASKLGLLR